MNCFFGTSNGSVENVIVDDENTTMIQISLCVNRTSYFDIQVVTNTRDLIQFNSQYYGFTYVNKWQISKGVIFQHKKL